MKMKLTTALCASVMLLATAAFAGEGLELGSGVGAFTVTDVTGPEAGKSLCYRCRYGSQPVVSIFARQVNDELATLVKNVDQVVGQNKGEKMAAFVVLLSDDPTGQEGALKSLAKDHGITNTPLTVFDDQNGPPSYKITDADFTVMMWVDGELKVNETFKSGQLTPQAVTQVVGKTGSILN
ncbi:MAG: hypothetical protein KDA52_13935 [Planctomycetaceae bacterium]|nr:hypothetical protein [Planctomycetaceae bacterium]